jgi:Spy/CpxP family protein refolding chaperone
MARQIACVMAFVLTCAPAFGAPAAAQQGRADKPVPARDGRAQTPPAPAAAAPKPDDRERGKWWLYDRAELGITEKQSNDINQVFESVFPKLRETRQELDRAEAELSRTIMEHKADVATISMLVDRVESVRSQNSKMRVLMLYQMHLLLTPEQRTKLEALRARRDAERKDKEKSQSERHRHP